MPLYTIKSFAWRLALGALVCLLMGLFSTGGAVYAGFAGGFLGALFLLMGWLKLLKTRGTDIWGLLKRKSPPEAPYFHRKDKQSPPSVWPGKNRFRHDDGLEADASSGYDSDLSEGQRLKGDAWGGMLSGVILLAASLFI